MKETSMFYTKMTFVDRITSFSKLSRTACVCVHLWQGRGETAASVKMVSYTDHTEALFCFPFIYIYHQKDMFPVSLPYKFKYLLPDVGSSDHPAAVRVRV